MIKYIIHNIGDMIEKELAYMESHLDNVLV